MEAEPIGPPLTPVACRLTPGAPWSSFSSVLCCNVWTGPETQRLVVVARIASHTLPAALFQLLIGSEATTVPGLVQSMSPCASVDR